MTKQRHINATRNNRKQAQASVLRIIGGKWRSRKLPFLALPELRPTPDRVKETLFNWLREDTLQARCLDLFCGSGALGLEALSREAKEVSFIDSNKATIDQLQRNCESLGTNAANLYQCSVQNWLRESKHQVAPFHIIFIDPPYRQGLVEPVCQALEIHSFTTEGTKVYIETEADINKPTLPSNWQCIKQKTAGQVSYSLYLVNKKLNK